MSLFKCKCGCDEFWKSVPVHGVWTSLIQIEDGVSKQLESTSDEVKHGDQPKTVTCCDCHKRHPNPDR